MSLYFYLIVLDICLLRCECVFTTKLTWPSWLQFSSSVWSSSFSGSPGHQQFMSDLGLNRAKLVASFIKRYSRSPLTSNCRPQPESSCWDKYLNTTNRKLTVQRPHRRLSDFEHVGLASQQGDINCSSSSHPDFVKNYFLSNFLSNSPFPPILDGRLEQLMSPFIPDSVCLMRISVWWWKAYLNHHNNSIYI